MSRIDSIKHNKKRSNIPTGELRNFMQQNNNSQTSTLYPRNSVKDPQLVWRGKDEQDKEPLIVPEFPIYIHEKIHPQAIIEGLRNQTYENDSEKQFELFSDFEGLEFEDLVEFYEHEQNWSNRFILGDSLIVMNSLAEKEGLNGQVQTIFFDPPYGIKFDSNWQIDTRSKVVKDGKIEHLTRQPEQIRAYRDTWELGVHSYLSYLRDRLMVSRTLLTESGSIFVQISDENVHLVRSILDEVYGRENFIAIIPFRKKTMPFGANFLEQMADYIIWYAKNKFDSDGKPYAKYRQLYLNQNVEGEFHHCWYELPDGTRHRMTKKQIDNHSLLPDGARVYRLKSLEPSGKMDSGMFNYEFGGRTFTHPKNGYATTLKGMNRLKEMRRLQVEGNRLTYIMYADENPAKTLTAPWFDTVGADNKVYVVQTNTEVIKRCILMSSDPGDLVLDPTCGSGTTPFVAEQWGRRWIGIDTSRVALTLARTRMMTAKYPYYLLVDSKEGVEKEVRISGKKAINKQTNKDVSEGFVYKRAPHITLSSMTNNEKIDEISDKYNEELNNLVKLLGQNLGKQFDFWNVPENAEESWSEESKSILNLFWDKTKEKNKELNSLIIEKSDVKILFNNPYENKKKIRVSGPFTVESISPHRVISEEEEQSLTEIQGKNVSSNGQFEQTIIQNLKIAGVQNTKKNERLSFSFLEPFPGVFIHSEGEYLENGVTKRVGICIGPENGTVGPELIREAAKEAIKGIGFDLLVVCGFAFDPNIGEEVKSYGRLNILITRMNPDLMIGNDYLKKTGAANLFTVFGEPDIEIIENNEMIALEIKGLDIFDPTTGHIRSSSTEDIACWFIDTSYNGESFFVRHAYFLGNDKQLEKLKRALKADIDSHVLDSIHSTKSREFKRPTTGKIAIKVINYFGDEVLKVFHINPKN
ncbi:site-specific DNA-methyltransferase [Fictibacillus sp. NRS-1165]|uniref:site-specific DNA-methyltransferase n=1 Tax=Fictibacillus sp. NRS-1165 TaxID=3144463 RepID=UPI003D25D69F